MKKIIAVFAVFALIFTPIAFVGCNGATMSFADYQALELTAAQSLKEAHIEYETFEDITYHWTESTTTKEIISLYYNQVAEGDDYTTGVFENSTMENRECWLAVKKAEGSLVAKLTNNITVVETDNFADMMNNDQYKQTVTTTVTQEVFYVTTATKESNTLNVVAYYKSTKVNDEDAVVIKKYQEADDLDGLTALIQGYALNYANASVVRNFFHYAELLLYPGYNTNLTKTENQVKYTFSYGGTDIGANLSWEKVEVSGTILYKNNKVFKAEGLSKDTTEDTSEVVSYSLDFTDSAIIDALDLDGYTEDAGTINLYKNSCQSMIG